MPTTQSLRWPYLGVAGGVVLLAAALRLPIVGQSLWYDEMYTLLNYILQPWEQIVAGQYSPNNHVLFNLLAKLVTPEYTDPAALRADIGQVAVLMRLVSVLAGVILPVALAWPLRKDRPYQAILMAVIAAVHPWSICLSGWARGYSLLLLLGVLATHWLPQRTRAVYWRYALALTAALYTQPIAVVLVPGHAMAMLFLRRQMMGTWLRSAGLAGVLTFFLYLPFLGGAGQYWSGSRGASIGYVQFVGVSLRHAQAGDDVGGAAGIAVALLVIIAGGLVGWRTPAARAMLMSFATAAVLGLLVPLVVPSAGEVRAMLWLIPLYCMGAAAILGAPMRMPWIGWCATAMLLIVLGILTSRIASIPAQPIRDAIAEARRLAGPGGRVIGVYMAAAEARAVYGNLDAIAYRATPLASSDPASLPSLQEAESASAKGAIAVVFYESFIQRDAPDLWRQLQQRYELVVRLPGRVSGAAIYRRTSP